MTFQPDLSSERRFQIGQRVVITAGLWRNTEVTVASSGGPAGYTVRTPNGDHIGVKSSDLRTVEAR